MKHCNSILNTIILGLGSIGAIGGLGYLSTAVAQMNFGMSNIMSTPVKSAQTFTASAVLDPNGCEYYTTFDITYSGATDPVMCTTTCTDDPSNQYGNFSWGYSFYMSGGTGNTWTIFQNLPLSGELFNCMLFCIDSANSVGNNIFNVTC